MLILWESARYFKVVNDGLSYNFLKNFYNVGGERDRSVGFREIAFTIGF